MSTDDDNQSLSKRIRSGDEQAIGEFTKKYEEEILRILRIQLRKTKPFQNSFPTAGSPTSTNINSLFNESLLRLITKIKKDELDQTDKILLLKLFKISKNLLIDRLRHRTVARNVSIESSTDPAIDDDPPGKKIELEEESQKAQMYLAELPKFQQDIFNLKASGMSFEEIGKLFNKSAGAIRAEYARIRKYLKDRMDK